MTKLSKRKTVQNIAVRIESGKYRTPIQVINCILYEYQMTKLSCFVAIDDVRSESVDIVVSTRTQITLPWVRYAV